jgi:hypothetical protein
MDESENESPIGSNCLDRRDGTDGMGAKGHRNYAVRRRAAQRWTGSLDYPIQEHRRAKWNELRA